MLFAQQETARQRGGSQARRAGRDFESLILASQNDSQGPACVLSQVKNYAKRIYDRDKKEMRLVEEKSPFDFCGCVWDRGIGIFIDAKSCGPDIASFRVNDPKIVKPHQLRALAGLERAGAFSGFMVRCQRMNDIRWIWASKAAQNCTAPIRWDSPLWEIVGIDDGSSIPFRKLFDQYK